METEWIIIALVALIGLIVGLWARQNNKTIGEVSNLVPLPIVQALFTMAMRQAATTEGQADDEALKQLAKTLGYNVADDGTLTPPTARP